MPTFESEVASTATEVMLAGEHRPTRPAVASWVLYDLANTIFSMGVVSLFFPQLVRDAVGTESDKTVLTYISSISYVLIFLVSPLLGAMTDRARRRMPFLIVSTVVCVLFTILLARAGFTVAAVCFVIANIAYNAGLQFYDALLPDVSTEENRGKIGGIGVGIGYLGSFIAVAIALILRGQVNAGTLAPAAVVPLALTIFAVLFLLFAVPCFLFVRERGNPRPRPIDLRMARESTRETIRTLRSTQQYPGLLRFLVGRVFYTDAINTVILVMVLFAVDVGTATGLTEQEGRAVAEYVMLTAIACAVAGGFVWGVLADRIGPKRTLDLVLFLWMAVFVIAALIGILTLPIWMFYIVACMAGVGMGGVWSADRPYMLRLTPPARIGEFYGLYGMVGRFSAAIGPFIFGSVHWLALRMLRAGDPALAADVTATAVRGARADGIAVLTLLAFIVVSYIILRQVSDAPRNWQGSDLSRA